MQFSPLQERAVHAVRQWHANPQKPWFYLAGFAGSGKTTLAQELASGIEGGVCFGAYTGKAAYVLQQKGCPNATTIHRLIYKPKDKSHQRLRELTEQKDHLWGELMHEARIGYPDDPNNPAIEMSVKLDHRILKLEEQIREETLSLKRPMFQLNLESELRVAKLTILDECSMIDDRMAEDILSFDCPVLVLGDPAQLPPVRGEGFFTKQEPDFLLDEVHRQAKDNPILRLANDVREGRGLSEGRYGDSVVMDLRDADESLYLAHDQMLVGKNETRRGCNRKIRSLLGREQVVPLPGDRLICLRNNHEVGLLNGGIWRVLDAVEIDEDEVGLTVRSEDGSQELNTIAHAAYFRNQEPPHWEIRERDCFAYGYAMTVHKSQGSQWNRVLIYDESRVFRDSARNWLYTAITRAAKQVTIVR